jgi:hypothetical protein
MVQPPKAAIGKTCGRYLAENLDASHHIHKVKTGQPLARDGQQDS